MKKKNLYVYLFLSFFIAFLCSCQTHTEIKENKFPILKGDYLGQPPPGGKAELFAPGIISTGMSDRDIAVSPDLDEIYYSVLEGPHYTIVCLKKDKGLWAKQTVAPFSGQYNDCEPQFSPDGRRLYFCSTRPVEGKGEPKDYDIWYVERTGSDWGEPINPGSPLNTEKNEFYPSITSDGTIYFTSYEMNICRSRYVEGKYKPPEILGDKINTPRGEYNSYIAPDESYLIFTSHGWDGGVGRGDLFICFRQNEDTWTKASNLGPGVNSSAVDMCPTVSPDGKYLFFSSMRKPEVFDPEPVRSYDELLQSSRMPQNGKMDIYWVDAKIIQDIKQEEGIEQSTFSAGEIHDAARNGEVKKIRQMLDKDLSLLNSKDQSGKTPLHFASQYGHFDIVTILIEKGAEVNAENNNGETPLHYASAYGQETIAELLISNGAELEYRSWRHGDTPAHAAAIGGHVEMVSFLAQKGALLDALNDFGETPLHYAADFGHIKVIEYLVSKGQKINSKNKNGWTPLHYAAFSGRTDAAELMISKGTNVAARDTFGQIPLYRASWSGHRKTAELLIVKGSDVNAKDKGGDTPLHGAAYEGHGDVVKLLISRGAEVNIKNKKGRTPLDNAILRMHKDIQDELNSKQGISRVNTHTRSQKETALRIDETGEQNPIKITILYDNYVYTEGTKSHWGFSCLIEGTEKTILFDTGWKPEILKNNIEKTGADIKKVRQIVISHNHGDHTGGVFSILDENPDVTVFLPYSFSYDFVRRVEERNAEVITVSKPLEICSNVYLTGEMGDQIKEHSLILNTHKGLVIIAGCSHQGIVNILKKAKEILKKEIYLVCGGFHLLHHSPAEVRDIIREFKELGVRYCGPTHCTGTHVIELFKEAFKDNYLQMGTGKVIRIE